MAEKKRKRETTAHTTQVPPVIIQLLRNQDLCAKHDLSSVRFVYTGAAPLGAETHEDMLRAFPGIRLGQGYGMTETSTVTISTSEHDVVVGTSGSLVPGVRARLLDEEGREITEHGRRGELLLQSPSVTLGYLNNERATSETFVHDEEGGRWIRTGDIAVVSRSPAGHEHFAVVDRLKELIKTKVSLFYFPRSLFPYFPHLSLLFSFSFPPSSSSSSSSLIRISQQGHQVAPAELEAHLLTHPAVNDCAVIPVPDERAGEVPKAFVVRSAEAAGKPDAEVARDVAAHVEAHKARYKWLKGGVEFVDVIPKSPSGKILRRLLKDKEREARRAQGAKL